MPHKFFLTLLKDVAFLKLYMSKTLACGTGALPERGKKEILSFGPGQLWHVRQASLTQYGNAIPYTAGASNNAKQRFSHTQK